MVEKPDEIIKHIPQYCTCCGRDISQIESALVECRQEVVLPVIQPIFIEHQAFQRTCTCGNTVVADFPDSSSRSPDLFGPSASGIQSYHRMLQTPMG